jgi:hypothetical protein
MVHHQISPVPRLRSCVSGKYLGNGRKSDLNLWVQRLEMLSPSVFVRLLTTASSLHCS